MLTETVDLYDYFGYEREKGSGGTLAVFARAQSAELGKKRRPAALIIPGGGYRTISDREGEPVALRLLAEGYVCFVLNYSVKTAYPVPLIEAAMAVAYIREKAKEQGIDPSHVAAFGFSAGGHLAAMLATLFAEDCVRRHLGKRNVRPDAVVLGYPVITTDRAFAHEGSVKEIAGDPVLRDLVSAEKRVTRKSSPAFVWHTAADGLVPVENSMLLAQAYRTAGVPFELHLFERGVHGLSLADMETANGEADVRYSERVQSWFPLALSWLKERGFSVSAK